MNVVGCVLHQQGGELQQADSQRVQQVSLLLWVKNLQQIYSSFSHIERLLERESFPFKIPITIKIP